MVPYIYLIDTNYGGRSLLWPLACNQTLQGAFESLVNDGELHRMVVFSSVFMVVFLHIIFNFKRIFQGHNSFLIKNGHFLESVITFF